MSYIYLRKRDLKYRDKPDGSVSQQMIVKYPSEKKEVLIFAQMMVVAYNIF